MTAGRLSSHAEVFDYERIRYRYSKMMMSKTTFERFSIRIKMLKVFISILNYPNTFENILKILFLYLMTFCS